jgi:hypothetical protein
LFHLNSDLIRRRSTRPGDTESDVIENGRREERQAAKGARGGLGGPWIGPALLHLRTPPNFLRTAYISYIGPRAGAYL